MGAIFRGSQATDAADKDAIDRCGSAGEQEGVEGEGWVDAREARVVEVDGSSAVSPRLASTGM